MVEQLSQQHKVKSFKILKTHHKSWSSPHKCSRCGCPIKGPSRNKSGRCHRCSAKANGKKPKRPLLETLIGYVEANRVEILTEFQRDEKTPES